MECRECGYEINHDAALFCPRCGAAQARDESVVTERIETGEEEAPTTSIEAPAVPGDQSAGSRSGIDVGELLRDVAGTARRSLVNGGWLVASSAAIVSFLAILCIGALLLVAGKFQYPTLGSGASSAEVITGIVLVALATLRVPIDLAGLEVTVLPLGALLVAGLAISWSATHALRGRTSEDQRTRALDGAKIGVPLGLLACIAAAICRYPGEDPVSADPVAAFVLAGFWGASFGALGGIRGGATPAAGRSRRFGGVKYLGRAAATWLDRRSTLVHEGVVAGGVMLLVATIFTTAAALVWVIVGLAGGPPSRGFSLGDAGATIIYLLAFGPNVLVALMSFSLGAAIEVGAQITQGGRLIGSIKEFSLFDWPRGSAPWYVYLLVLIPLVACTVGGFAARRHRTDGRGSHVILGVAAAFFAGTLGLLAAIGDARLGAGLIRDRGIGRVAADSGMVLLLGGAWALVAGFVGWRLASGRTEGHTPVPEPRLEAGITETGVTETKDVAFEGPPPRSGDPTE